MNVRLARLNIIAALAAVLLAVGGQLGHAQQVSATLAGKSPDAAALATTAQDKGFVRVIVLLDAPVAPTQARPDAAAVATIKARVAATQDTVLTNQFGDARNLRPGKGFARGLTRFEITPGFAVSVDPAELEALAADPLVKSISIDRAMPPTLLQSLPLIGQPTAYNNGATGANWAVAVLDTGVQANHEFLNGKVVAEACFSNAGGLGGNVSLCPNGLSSQTGSGAANSTTANCINGSTNLCQHGTHVSGIAAGLNTNQSTGEPTNGVARDGKIFAIQVFTRFNNASDCSPGSAPCVLSYTSDQISALDYVYQHLTPASGVTVASVNMSLGGGLTSSACDGDPQKTSIDNLRAAGVLTAIAAGNDGSKTQISHPACISSAVAVGSTTKTDAVSSFSNMATIVALLAPGGFGGGSCSLGGNNPDILSSYPGITSGTTNLYACEAGTSMATPHVAGAIAALRTACPSVTAAAILGAFQSTGVSITDTRTGAPGTITKPRIRLDSALTALNCNAPGVLVVSPNSNISTSGVQGGPFAPTSFNYTLSASVGSRSYAITGVPTWLTASSTSGTVTTTGTTVTFTVNANANGFSPGVYASTVTFTDTGNNTTALQISATLIVSATGVLNVTPATGMASVGTLGGPFSPSSFQYQLSTNNGTVGYSISGLPAWLTASSTSGTVATSPVTITFTVNANANSLPVGGYNATISFTNTTNARGNQTRNAALTVNSGGTAAPATRTWVSGTGNDNNDCTRTAPCLTFAGALAKTTAGGEINCLDSAGFGTLTINKAVTIDCREFYGSVLASGTTGIVINASGALVTLRNIRVMGVNSGLKGISIVAASQVKIEDCVVSDFTQQGILDTRPGSGNILIIRNTTVRNNAAAGIVAAAGTNSNMLLDNVHSVGNSYGVAVATGNNVAVKRSVMAGNTAAGVEADAGAKIEVDGTVISHNNFGVQAGGTIILGNSDITFNATAIAGSTTSFGNNRIFGNTNVGTIPSVGVASTDHAQQ